MFLSNLFTQAQSKNYSTYAALIFTIIVWGMSFVAIKIVLQSFTPFVYIFSRFSLASCFFIIYLLRKGIPALSAKTHKKLLLLAFFEPGLYFTFETLGLTYTTASKTSIIIAIIPIAVMLLAHFILGEKIGRKSIIGIPLSFLGISILVIGEPGFSWAMGKTFYGDLFILAAVVAAAFYMIIVRDLGKTLSSIEITCFQIIYGTVFFAPFFIINVSKTDWAAISFQSLIALIFLSLFATVGGFLGYNYALTQIPASRAAVFQNGIPVVTAIAACLILHESLTPLQIFGGLIALFALTLTNMPERQKKAVAPESKKSML